MNKLCSSIAGQDIELHIFPALGKNDNTPLTRDITESGQCIININKTKQNKKRFMQPLLTSADRIYLDSRFSEILINI